MSFSLLFPPRSSSADYCSCCPSHADTCTPIEQAKTDNKHGIYSLRVRQTGNMPRRTLEGDRYSRGPESSTFSKCLSDWTPPPPGLAQLPLLQSPYYGAKEPVSNASVCASGSHEKWPDSNNCPQDQRQRETKHPNHDNQLLKQATAPPNCISSPGPCTSSAQAPAQPRIPTLACNRLAAIVEAEEVERGCYLSSHTAAAPLPNVMSDCCAAAPTNANANAIPTREPPRLWSGVVKKWAQPAQSPPQKQQSPQLEHRSASGVKASDSCATQATACQVAPGACQVISFSHTSLYSQASSFLYPTTTVSTTTVSSATVTATPTREQVQMQMGVRERWQKITPSRFFKLNPRATEFVPAALRTTVTAQPQPDANTSSHTKHSTCCDSGVFAAQRQIATTLTPYVTQTQNHKAYDKPEQSHQTHDYVKAVASIAASASGSAAAAELTPVVNTHGAQNKKCYKKWSEIVASPALPVYSAHRFREHQRPVSAIKADISSQGSTNSNEAQGQATRTWCTSTASSASPYLPLALQLPQRVPSRSSRDNASGTLNPTASPSTSHTIPCLQPTFATQQTHSKSTLHQHRKRYEMATASVAPPTENFEDFPCACANTGSTSSLSFTFAARPTNTGRAPTNSRRLQKRNSGNGGRKRHAGAANTGTGSTGSSNKGPRRWSPELTPIEELELNRGEQHETRAFASAETASHFDSAATSPFALRASRATSLEFEFQGMH